MIYSIINDASSPLARRLLAAMSLVLLPVLLVLALILGTLSYFVDFAKAYFDDLRYMVTREVPGFLKTIFRVIRTGGYAS